MAIAIDNPDLREGQEIVLWQVVPPRVPGEARIPGRKRITSPIRGKGRIVPGGIDYENATLTIRTANGEVITGPATDADFAQLDNT